MFRRIVHSDWSKLPEGRWSASARRIDGGWQVEGPSRVGHLPDFVDRLVGFGTAGPTLAAFDFPIGLPIVLRTRPGFAAVPDFPAALGAFGGPGWDDFLNPAVAPADVSPSRPFYPAKPGAAKLRHLLDALGVATIAELTRLAERGGPGKRAAGCMFWLVGAKTVGKAAIHGWVEAIRPALARGAKLWPFDGNLDDLAADGGLVLAESYPAEAVAILALMLTGSKNSSAVLKAVAPAILAWTVRRHIDLSPELREAIETGFAAFAPNVGDAFDAVVGLLAAIAVADREHPDGAPNTDAVRRWEGWILGR